MATLIEKLKQHRICALCTILLALIAIALIAVLLLWIHLGQTIDDHFTDQCLKSHNQFRMKHGAKPLKASKELIKIAAERAEKLVELDRLQHLPDNRGYGENLYMMVGALSDCPQATKSWYDEFSEFKYDYSRPEFSYETGHATQVVWKDTEKLGCASRSFTTRMGPKQYTVCLYDPAGNILNHFKENIQPPK